LAVKRPGNPEPSLDPGSADEEVAGAVVTVAVAVAVDVVPGVPTEQAASNPATQRVETHRLDKPAVDRLMAPD